MDTRMQDIHRELVAFTRDCRDDMHEPDEQGIGVSAVLGDHLDNAFGNVIMPEAVGEGFQEYVVIMEDEKTDRQLKVNLADLIALARQAGIMTTKIG